MSACPVCEAVAVELTPAEAFALGYFCERASAGALGDGAPAKVQLCSGHNAHLLMMKACMKLTAVAQPEPTP